MSAVNVIRMPFKHLAFKRDTIDRINRVRSLLLFCRFCFSRYDNVFILKLLCEYYDFINFLI